MNYIQLNETYLELKAKQVALEQPSTGARIRGIRKKRIYLRWVVDELEKRMRAVRDVATNAVIHAASFIAGDVGWPAVKLAGEGMPAVKLAEAARNLRQGNPDVAAAAARESIRLSLGSQHREAELVKVFVDVIRQEEALATEAVAVYKSRED